MTKQDFFNLLESDSDDLNQQEKEKLKSFYEKEFFDISDKEDISDRLRKSELPAFLSEIFHTNNTNKNDADPDDLIFSRPPVKAKAPEIIHSMEDKEVKTLYGEKVILEIKKEEIPQVILEPLDEANGLTDEEIMKAKAQTLEKTEKFAEMEKAAEETNTNTEESANEKSPVYIEEEDEYELPALKEKKRNIRKTIISKEIAKQLAKEKQKPKKTVKVEGFVDVLFQKTNLDSKARIPFFILFSFICSPLLLIALSLAISLYLVVLTAVLSAALALFLVMASIIVIGVIELIYSVVYLFKSVPVALVELGLGTILFSIVTAFGALFYQYIFGILPIAFKKVSHFFFEKMHKARIKLYGGSV